MVWGHFNLYFVLAFVLWALYSASLYIAGKIEDRGNRNVVKTVCCGFLFGMLASCIKTGLDSLIMMMAGKTNNPILLTFAMEMGILLFGGVLIVFVFYAIRKGQFTRKKPFNKYMGILGGIIGIYAVAFFWFYSKYKAFAAYTDITPFTESGNVNLNTLLEMENFMKYSKTFTMLSMITYVTFFLVLWYGLEKLRQVS